MSTSAKVLGKKDYVCTEYSDGFQLQDYAKKSCSLVSIVAEHQTNMT